MDMQEASRLAYQVSQRTGVKYLPRHTPTGWTIIEREVAVAAAVEEIKQLQAVGAWPKS